MAAPRWRIEIHKRYNAEKWANDYLTDDLTIEDAQDLANELLSWEKNVHQTTVLFEYILISTYAKEDRVFRHLTINQFGLVGAVDSLPLYCTLRLDLPTADSDPCRKYYRAPVAESQQANGFLMVDYLNAINTGANNQLVVSDVVSHIVSNKGNKVIGATFHNTVQMRQLHRRRKKKQPTPPGA